MDLGPNGPIEHGIAPTGLPAGRAERMALAKLSGAVDRWMFGEGQDLDDETRLQVLLGYTADPRLWGAVLGNALARVQRGEGAYERAAELARAAGADEAVAEAHRVWLMTRPAV